MKRTTRLWVAAFLAVSSSMLSAMDLSRIDRIIVAEPKYQSKAVNYCLLVFGREAKTRVWLAQDGDILYVDRNGNGDLTEPGEKVVAEQEKRGEREYNFKVGDIRDGDLTHKSLQLAVRKIQG